MEREIREGRPMVRLKREYGLQVVDGEFMYIEEPAFREVVRSLMSSRKNNGKSGNDSAEHGC